MQQLDPNHPLREAQISPAAPSAWTLGELARCIDGKLICNEQHHVDESTSLGRVRIDSRSVGAGDVFVALRGAQTHGADHIPAAAQRGAVAAIVGSDTSADKQQEVLQYLPLIVVDVDSLVAVGRVARAWRRLVNPVVVGITGSSGKTSTKDLLFGILCQQRVHASAENQNNELGVPLTLLNAPADTQVVICEMGMRGPHQIDYLCSIAEPDIAVVTNAGLAHIELLGTAQNIVSAKSEIVASLGPHGTSVTPSAQPEILESANRYAAHAGRNTDGRTDRTFHLNQPGIEEWKLTVSGPHQQSNLAAALVTADEVCRRLGVDPPHPHDLPLQISRGRGERMMTPAGITVIDDSYNANPDSVRAALTSLSNTLPSTPAGRRIAVLGLMAELGSHGPELHRAVGEFLVVSQAADVAVLVGSDSLVDDVADGISAALKDVDYQVSVYRALTTDQAVETLHGLLHGGDVVLVKASRSARLEGVVHALLEPDGAVEGTPT